MFGFVGSLIDKLLDLYKLAVIAHFIIALLKVPANKWTTLLASAVEPVLAVVRRLVNKYLPKEWQILDWSPIALILAITVVQWIL